MAAKALNSSIEKRGSAVESATRASKVEISDIG